MQEQVREQGLQEKYAPQNSCFGCGPANTKGLRIRSIVQGEEVVAQWRPEPHHEAFPGVLNGGIIGTLLDCHSNWTAAWHLMKQQGAAYPPCTVTADYSIHLLRPTPTDGMIYLSARVAQPVPAPQLPQSAEPGLLTRCADSRQDRVVIDATLTANGKVCATCRGTFVAVRPGHPAYHRW